MLLSEVGIDAALIDGDEIKNQLRVNADEAVSRGAFGAPTFFVGGEMFWGNDRLEFVEEALVRREVIREESVPSFRIP